MSLFDVFHDVRIEVYTLLPVGGLVTNGITEGLFEQRDAVEEEVFCIFFLAESRVIGLMKALEGAIFFAAIVKAIKKLNTDN